MHYSYEDVETFIQEENVKFMAIPQRATCS